MANNFIVLYNQNGSLEYLKFNVNEDNSVDCILLPTTAVIGAVFLDGASIKTPVTDIQKNFFKSLTLQERFMVSSEFFDSDLVNWNEARKAGSKFCPKLETNIFTNQFNSIFK